MLKVRLNENGLNRLDKTQRNIGLLRFVSKVLGYNL